MGQMISIVQVKNKGACAEVGRERGINQSGYAVRSFNRSSARPAPLLRLLAVTETCTATTMWSLAQRRGVSGGASLFFPLSPINSYATSLHLTRALPNIRQRRPPPRRRRARRQSRRRAGGVRRAGRARDQDVLRSSGVREQLASVRTSTCI